MNLQIHIPLENVDPDSIWSYEVRGFCTLYYREVANRIDPSQPCFDSRLECESAGSADLTAPLRERLAHFMSTQCPSDDYWHASATDDLATQWIKVRNDYIAIAKCFNAWETFDDPLRERLEDPDDPLDKWIYQLIWTYTELFQTFYAVITEKWELLNRVANEFAQHNPKFQFPGNSPYDVCAALLSEVSDGEIAKYFQPFYENRAYPFYEFVKLLRRQIGRTRELDGQEKRELTPEEHEAVNALFLKYAYDGDALFARVQWIWGILAKRDPWLADKLEHFYDLAGECMKAERDVLFYRSKIKHHRPSTTWVRGHKKLNKRNPNKNKQQSDKADDEDPT